MPVTYGHNPPVWSKVKNLKEYSRISTGLCRASIFGKILEGLSSIYTRILSLESSRNFSFYHWTVWAWGQALQIPKEWPFSLWLSGPGFQDLGFRTWTHARPSSPSSSSPSTTPDLARSLFLSLAQDLGFRTWISGRGFCHRTAYRDRIQFCPGTSCQTDVMNSYMRTPNHCPGQFWHRKCNRNAQSPTHGLCDFIYV